MPSIHVAGRRHEKATCVFAGAWTGGRTDDAAPLLAALLPAPFAAGARVGAFGAGAGLGTIGQATAPAR